MTAPNAQTLLTVEMLHDIIGQHLTSLYCCSRVWSAWNIGTMSEEDFTPAGETEFAADLAGAIHSHFTPIPTTAMAGHELAIEMLVAAGHVTREKADEALRLANAAPGPDSKLNNRAMWINGYAMGVQIGRGSTPSGAAAATSEPTSEPMPWTPASRDQAKKPTDTICALHFYYGLARKFAPDWLPSRILLAKPVSGDFPIGHDTIAEAGEHDCQSNKWGALSVLATNGRQLGIKPGEYTPVAWRRNEEATYG